VVAIYFLIINLQQLKYLYIIRHAKSCWEDPSLGDFERPLNTRGKKDAPRMATIMKEEERRPDLIVSSPAKRAIVTARIFADAFTISHEEIMEEATLYEASVEDIFGVLRTIPADIGVVYLFGHNPSLTHFVNLFGGKRLDNLPTTGIAKMLFTGDDWSHFDPKNASNSRLLYPKLIK